MKRLLRSVRWLLLSVTLAFLAVLGAHLALRPNQQSADAEQYKVLSAYVRPGLTGEAHDLGSSTGHIVIAARTTFSQPMMNSNKFQQYKALVFSTGHAKSNIRGLSLKLVFEFWAVNLKDIPLQRRFQLGAPYELANDEEMNLYPSAKFIARFPDSYGTLTFSRVAFNRDMTEAFFYTEHLCGLCGEGKFVFMRNIAGKWSVADSASTWIS
jgi:hypothetical protein